MRISDNDGSSIIPALVNFQVEMASMNATNVAIHKYILILLPTAMAHDPTSTNNVCAVLPDHTAATFGARRLKTYIVKDIPADRTPNKPAIMSLVPLHLSFAVGSMQMDSHSRKATDEEMMITR